MSKRNVGSCERCFDRVAAEVLLVDIVDSGTQGLLVVDFAKGSKLAPPDASDRLWLDEFDQRSLGSGSHYPDARHGLSPSEALELIVSCKGRQALAADSIMDVLMWSQYPSPASRYERRPLLR